MFKDGFEGISHLSSDLFTVESLQILISVTILLCTNTCFFQDSEVIHLMINCAHKCCFESYKNACFILVG
jgi:hypothetical protein